VRNTAHLREHEFASRGHAAYATFIQNFDERGLLIVWGAFIFFVLSVAKYNLFGVCAFAAFPIFIMISGSLPAKAILKRILLISPFILVMAAANPFLDKRDFATVAGMAISAGMVSAAVITAKSVISILAIMTLMYCVPFCRLCAALRGFRIPEAFVIQLILVYRYLFVLAEEALSIDKARQMRSFGRKGRDLFSIAKMIGSFFVRSMERADRVYRAMVARGFHGNLYAHHLEPFRGRDVLFVAGALVIFTSIRILI
jgi:cobalt/nickel transport system permease protein